MFEIRKRFCGLCLVGKIAPEHCTTIPKAELQKTLEVLDQFRYPKIVIYVSIIEFYKRVIQLGVRYTVDHRGFYT